MKRRNPFRGCPSVNTGRDTTPDTPALGRAVRVKIATRPIEGLYESLPARQGDSRGRLIPSPAWMAWHFLPTVMGTEHPRKTGHHGVHWGEAANRGRALSTRTRQVMFRRRLERLASTVSTTVPSPVLPRRLAAVLIAALFGLTLALNPMSATNAQAAVPANVALQALHIAATQYSVAYRYGGESHATGFDCSGLTQWSYARAGRYIPRTAQQQYNATIHIPASARRQGDLVFFHTGSSVYHVGIFAGGWYIIDAPHTGARVQLERIWSSQVLFGQVR